MSVCKHISDVEILPIFCVHFTYVHGSSGNVAMHYVLLILWMTLCFHIMGPWWHVATTVATYCSAQGWT